MLSMADTSLDLFLPVFATTGVPVAFLVPTPTGYGKSIMDATSPVRQLLKDAGLHDYASQRQGPENKVQIKSYFVSDDELIESKASLYRPQTKQGDPRIWFADLRRYCSPCNLLAIIVKDECLYVLNLSKQSIARSLCEHGAVYDLLVEANQNANRIADDLRSRIQAIHDLGFIPAITSGDTAVGDTLEHALGIERNNSRLPDFMGIELKASRLTRNGTRRATTRQTLFTKVPDIGKSYREIVEAYGKWQIPRNSTEPRFQLYETFRVSRPNAYGLRLNVDERNDDLQIVADNEGRISFVSAWHMQTLREAVLSKHHETFWVKAESIMRDGREYFRYDKILHTRGPNVTLMASLFEADKITLDLAAHLKEDGSWRDHGILFKMLPDDLHYLVGEPIEYDL